MESDMAPMDLSDLQPGDSSEYVQYLQQLLNHHYQQDVVPESGEFDDTTANAVEVFRAQNGLADGSTVDSEVWAKLLGQ
jgi:peptidoglycan hydrolase-like protein with peptidoglycan-binding domain